MSLIGWWPLDGNANDYSFNYNNGTTSNVTWVDGKIGQAAHFENGQISMGANDSISAAISASGEVSLCAWIFISESFSGERVIIRKESEFQLGFASSTHLRNLLYTDGTNGWTGTNDILFNFEVEKWYHLATTYNGSDMKTYIDSNLVATKNVTGGIVTNSNSVKIGSTNGRYFPGNINDARIYDHELSQREINELYQSNILDYNISDMQSEPTTNLANTEIARTIENYTGTMSTETKKREKGKGWRELHITHRGTGFRQFKFPYIVHNTNTTKTYSVEYDFGTTTGYYWRMDGFYGGIGTPHDMNGKFYSVVTTTDNSGSLSIFLCNDTVNIDVDDIIYYRYYQVEEKDHPTDFTEDTRDVTLYDNSGFKRNTTITESVQPILRYDEELGMGYYEFSGDEYFKPNLPVNPRDAITLSVWIKRTTDYTVTTDTHILTKSGAWYFYDSYGSGYIRADVWIDDVRQCYGLASLPFDGKWYMITYTYDSADHTGRMYRNGEIVDSRTVSGLDNYLIDASTADMSNIGYNTKSKGYQMTKFQVFATALSADEIKNMYQSKIKIDDHGNLYAKEIVEDYEISGDLTLRELFEDKRTIPPISLPYINNQTSGAYYSTYTWYMNNDNLIDNHILFTHFKVKEDLNVGIGLFYVVSSTQANTCPTGYVDLSSGYNLYGNIEDYKAMNFYRGITYDPDQPVTTTIKEWWLIDLTEIFGAGNEPTEDQMNIWYRDYISSRPKNTGIIKTREFNEIEEITQSIRISKDKIKIKGSFQEGR